MSNIVERIGNKIVNHTQWYDQFWGGVRKFWSLKSFNIDVVNLGSNSGKYSFNYDGLDIDGRNWAIGPQSLEHDFNILKNYFSYLKPGATVLIIITPFSSLVSKYSKASNLKYYTFLHPATIIGFEDSERTKALRIKQSPIREMPWYCVKNTLKELCRRICGRAGQRCDMEQHACSFIEMWKKQFGIENLEAPLSEKHQEEQKNRITVLREMIEFCEERELRPVLVIPPVYHTLGAKLSSCCRENYIYSFIRSANVREIPFLDYMDDCRFQEERYFRNSFFMSEEGAKKFTKTILDKLGIL